VGFGLLGVRLPAFDPWLLLAVFALSMTALYALGMTMSSVFLLYGAARPWHMANALSEPVYFLSGLYFPLRNARLVRQWRPASLVPLGFGVDAMAAVMLGDAARGLLPLRTELAILAVLSAVFLVPPRVALAHLERSRALGPPDPAVAVRTFVRPHPHRRHGSAGRSVQWADPFLFGVLHGVAAGRHRAHPGGHVLGVAGRPCTARCRHVLRGERLPQTTSPRC